MEFRYQHGDESLAVRVERAGTGYTVTVAGREMAVSAAEWRAGVLTFTLDGRRHAAQVAADGSHRWVAFDSQPVVLTVPDTSRRSKRGRSPGHDTLEAQMPGVVRQVLVQVGQAVERGQALLVLEAMKMEIRVTAPHAGVVEQLPVREGETVGRGQLLVALEAKPE